MGKAVIIDICDNATAAAKMKGFREASGLFLVVVSVAPDNLVVGVTCTAQDGDQMPTQSPGAKWHKAPGKWLVVSVPK